jgi:hypothetical protein
LAVLIKEKPSFQSRKSPLLPTLTLPYVILISDGFDLIFSGASSAGGAPFLFAYGLTLFVTAILYFFLPIQVVALVAMFQGSLALPLAFWLERRLGAGPISPDNPLRPLSVQMAMSQILVLPAVIGWI